MTTKERYNLTFEYFEKVMPVAETELIYKNPFHLMVAVILSAQCTDKRVNQITPELLREFPDPQSMAKATSQEIYSFIKSCSYPNNKANHLVGMSRTLMEKFNGIVPEEPEELMKLPGVGRKTANVIASVLFNKPVMAVDTHVFRVSARIGLTRNAKNPLECEMQLTKNIPGRLVHKAHHWLILHGRYVCSARKPECMKCGLKEICQWYQKNHKGSKHQTLTNINHKKD